MNFIIIVTNGHVQSMYLHTLYMLPILIKRTLEFNSKRSGFFQNQKLINWLKHVAVFFFNFLNF